MDEPCLCGALDCRACRGSDARPDYDGDDISDQTLELAWEWLQSIRSSRAKGDDESARQCAREAIAVLQEIAGDQP